MIDKQKLGLIFIISFILLTLWIGINNQKFVTTISSGSFGIAILYYIISRVDYLLIFISLFLLRISTPIKEFFAGILLIWSIDILSFPRLPMQNLTTDTSLMANSDFLFMSKLLAITKWEYTFAWKFYYIVLPIILVLLVGYTLGLVKLGKRLNGG